MHTEHGSSIYLASISPEVPDPSCTKPNFCTELNLILPNPSSWLFPDSHLLPQISRYKRPPTLATGKPRYKKTKPGPLVSPTCPELERGGQVALVDPHKPRLTASQPCPPSHLGNLKADRRLLNSSPGSRTA